MVSNNESDVLIIGGDICGVATAFHLAWLGERVTLLEREELAGEATGVNAGGLGGFGWGDNPDLQSFLTAGSFEIFKSLQLDMGYDIEFHAPGGLQAIHTAEQWDFARERVFRAQTGGYHAELLTAREARAIEPEASESLAGFMFLTKRGRANPTKATVAFVEAAASFGATIKTGRNVQAITQQQDGSWQVQTNQVEFRAKTLALAVGAWSRPVGDMLGIEIPVAPIKGQMWATKPVPPSIFHLSGSMVSQFDWSSDRSSRVSIESDRQSTDDNYPPEITHRGGARITRHLYGGQTRNGEITFGDDRQMVRYDYTPDATGIKVNRSQATEVFPMLSRLPISRT